MILFWTVYEQAHIHTHLDVCRQQSSSLGLRESLGLPDLHSSRKLMHAATDRTKAASLCSISLFSPPRICFLPCTHMHIVKVKNLQRSPCLKTIERNQWHGKVQYFGIGNDQAHLHGLHASRCGIAHSKWWFSNKKLWSKTIFTMLQSSFKHQGKPMHSISGNCYKCYNLTQSYG